MNNQRQIAMSVQMWSNDHDEMFPDGSRVWTELTSAGLDKNILICPTKGKSVANGYVYNNGLSGRTASSYPKPEEVFVSCDGDPSSQKGYENVMLSGSEPKLRHSGSIIESFCDGHVELRKNLTGVGTTLISWTSNGQCNINSASSGSLFTVSNGGIGSITNTEVGPDYVQCINATGLNVASSMNTVVAKVVKAGDLWPFDGTGAATQARFGNCTVSAAVATWPGTPTAIPITLTGASSGGSVRKAPFQVTMLFGGTNLTDLVSPIVTVSAGSSSTTLDVSKIAPQYGYAAASCTGSTILQFETVSGATITVTGASPGRLVGIAFNEP